MQISSIKSSTGLQARGGYFTERKTPSGVYAHKGADIDAYISFKGISAAAGVQQDDSADYHKAVSKGMRESFEADIPPENLSCLLSPGQLRRLLPSFTIKNFVASPENIHRGIYSADLDYITTFSYNGSEDSIDVMDEAAKFANFYNWRTGKKFTFSITDNDTVEGLWRILCYIGENPYKFRNMNFVPGVKLSFAHRAPNSNLGFENSRMLVYSINPGSAGITSYIDNMLERRRNMVYDFIHEASKLYREFGYQTNEFSLQNKLVFSKDLGQSNLYWRVREYITSKGETSILSLKLTPQDIYQLSEDIFNGMDKVLKGSDETISSQLFSNIIDDDQEVNILIKELFDRYSTHYNESLGRAESAGENIFTQMINCFSNEPQKPVMSIASPYYFSHHFETGDAEGYPNTVLFFNYLKRNSDNMLIGYEAAAPMYDFDIELTPEIIQGFNRYVKEHTGLLETGGSFASRALQSIPI